MRALLLAAVLLGGCTAHLGRLGLRLGLEGEVTDHSHARMPRSVVGLRLSVIRHP